MARIRRTKKREKGGPKSGFSARISQPVVSDAYYEIGRVCPAMHKCIAVGSAPAAPECAHAHRQSVDREKFEEENSKASQQKVDGGHDDLALVRQRARMWAQLRATYPSEL